jgi:hypothetical protein
MSDSILLRQTGLFFSSDKWWSPVLSFIYTKCSAFYADNPTHEEFEIYQSYMDLVINLIDNEFCRKSKIAPSAFENVMFSLVEGGDHAAQVIMDTNDRATDFVEFRSQMVACNIRTEVIVSQALADFAKKHPEVTDPDAISETVAREAQAKINAELAELVRRGAMQMRVLLELDHPQTEPEEQETEKPEDDVERRRKFFARQRDILKEQDRTQKGSQTPVPSDRFPPRPPVSKVKGRVFRSPSKPNT